MFRCSFAKNCNIALFWYRKNYTPMFIIEGMIGAGKSTFLQLLQSKIPSISTVQEPVHNWEKNIQEQSLLDYFYKDARRWAYTFELMTLMHRAHDYSLLQQTNKVFFIERSLYSGYHCFAYNSFLQGFLSPVEWQLYQKWFNLINKNHTLPRGFIYLRVDPAIAYQRIQKRRRCAEQTISFDYLEQIYKRHEEFLINRNHIYTAINHIPVLVLDVNKDFEHDHNIMNDFVDLIGTFVLHNT